MIKIDAIFEVVGAGDFDEWGDGVEESAVDALVGVSDVFRDEREEDPAVVSIRHFSGEEIEEEEESGLAAGGDGDVLRADVPAERVAEELGDGVEEKRISARWVVAGQRAFESAGFCEDFRDALLPDSVDGRDVCGLAAAEHFEGWAGGCERVSEIVHQFTDSAAGCEVLAKF